MHKQILVIAPNFELEKCGISDYINVFREEALINFSHQVFILALSDKYVNKVVHGEFYMRIPAGYSPNSKILLLKDLLQKNEYQQVYFNLELYGYQSKGIPFYLLKCVSLLQHAGHIRIIVHEIWLQPSLVFNIKKKLLGIIQKWIMIRILKNNSIQKIFVNAELFQNILAKNSINTELVSVFNNFPLLTPFEKNEPSATIKLILFGSIVEKIQIPQLTSFFSTLIKLNPDHTFCIHHIGIYRGYTSLWEKFVASIKNFGIHYVQDGIMSPEGIDRNLMSAHVGLTTYRSDLMGKSGAVAAYFARGLPVLTLVGDVVSSGYLQEGKIFDIHSFPSNAIASMQGTPNYLYNSERFKQLTAHDSTK